MALRDEIKKAMPDNRAVGLADNSGTKFECRTCEYFDERYSSKGICQNEHPKLNGKTVGANWCCNLYDHAGMKVIIA